MIDKHVSYVEQAAKEGAQVMCFQELFYGPYFCQIQDPKYYGLTEPIPDGPTVKLMQAQAKKHKMVLIVPMYEEDNTGVYYNTAAVIDADGMYLGKYRKTHIPHVSGFWEKFYFKPGNLGYPVFNTAVGRVGVYICYDRHFPEGPRMLGLHGAELIFIPSATSRGLSMHLWEIEQRAHAIFNGVFVGTINRVGQESEFGPNDYYGSSYFCDPRGQYVPDLHTSEGKASDTKEQLVICNLDMDKVREVRNTWQFYRDRRPEMYGDIANPAA
jgi:N-carbamoylputrescine amidase